MTLAHLPRYALGWLSALLGSIFCGLGWICIRFGIWAMDRDLATIAAQTRERIDRR